MLFYFTTFAYMKPLMYIYIIIKANNYTNLIMNITDMTTLNDKIDQAVIKIMKRVNTAEMATYNEINEIEEKILEDVVNPAFNEAKTAIRKIVYSMTTQYANAIGLKKEWDK